MVKYNHSKMISLRSKTTQKILNFFFLNDKERFYVNELAKVINEDSSNVYKKLIELKKEGILADDFQGIERYFFINKDYKFLKEYKNILLKKIGFEKVLKEKLKEVPGIASAYIFGSYAKDKMSAESDIDLLIVGDFKTIELQKVLLEVQKLSGREINSIELLNKEFDKKIAEKDELLIDIFSKKHIKVI